MRNKLVESIDTYLESCLARQTPPQVSELAAQLGITRFVLTKKFRSRYGVDLSAYFKHQQIACAKHLLAYTPLSIATVARHSAFLNERTFHRAFRRITGQAPGAYRRACRECQTNSSAR